MKRLTGFMLFALLCACAQQPHRDVVDALAGQLVFQYHDCVPLGWAPVEVRGSYYPGFTATMSSYEMWLDAIWRGRITTSDLHQSGARQVRLVLDHLVSAGLLEEKPAPSGYDYFLRPAAFPYFYGSSEYDNNHDSLPYLCYTTVVPDRIIAMKKTRGQRYDVTFAWHASAPAGWASDPVLRSHTAVLPPVSSPTMARMFEKNGTWYVTRIANHDWMLPSLADARAWR